MESKRGLTVKQAKEILKNHPLVIPDSFSHIRKELEGFRGASKKFANAFRKQIEQIERAQKILYEGFKKFGELYTPSLYTLAEHGWYVCGSSAMSDSIELSEEIRKGNIGKVDKFMVDFYQKELEFIISNVIKSYPGRKAMINEAKLAHEREMYFSSTSLFISSADGILNGTLFRFSNSGKKPLQKELKNIDHLKDYGELLIKKGPIDASDSEIHLFNSTLSRHLIMHGKDTKYGTKVNSLKALSLLGFVCDFFTRKKSEI